MGEGSGTSQLIHPVFVAGLGEGGRGGNVAHVHGADAGFADGGKEFTLFGNRHLEPEQGLHEQVGPQEGVGQSAGPNGCSDRRVVAQKPHRRAGRRRPLRLLDEVPNACLSS